CHPLTGLPAVPAFLLFPHLPPHEQVQPFPPRRSSDLSKRCVRASTPPSRWRRSRRSTFRRRAPSPRRARARQRVRRPPTTRARRSEEHTSELQSPCNVVCRLLLEKKNPRKQEPYDQYHENSHAKHWDYHKTPLIGRQPT